MSRISSAKIAAFRKVIWTHFKIHGRHELPWRKTHDPYRVLVSEVMLQQTQVDRVIPFYKNFLRSFPTAKKLATAPLSSVLTHWQGLGYNRRAKLLQQAAQEISGRFAGKFPKSIDDIESLPGVGPYTARAVAAFAYNEDSVFIETNIRTVIIHHFFQGASKVKKTKGRNSTIYGTFSDEQIREVLAQVTPEGKAREWYAALMDYGAALKHEGLRTNARVAGYTKQKPFAGSLREARGGLLRALVGGAITTKKALVLYGEDREEQMKAAMATLLKDGLITLSRGKVSLPGVARP